VIPHVGAVDGAVAVLEPDDGGQAVVDEPTRPEQFVPDEWPDASFGLALAFGKPVTDARHGHLVSVQGSKGCEVACEGCLHGPFRLPIALREHRGVISRPVQARERGFPTGYYRERAIDDLDRVALAVRSGVSSDVASKRSDLGVNDRGHARIGAPIEQTGTHLLQEPIGEREIAMTLVCRNTTSRELGTIARSAK